MTYRCLIEPSPVISEIGAVWLKSERDSLDISFDIEHGFTEAIATSDQSGSFDISVLVLGILSKAILGLCGRVG